MVNTKKFSEFQEAALNDPNAQFVGLENGVNTKTDETKTWTTATRPASPYNGLLGFNTTLQQYEYYDAILVSWTQLEDSGDVNDILTMLASHASGEGASLVGLQNQGIIVNKTLQDLANATFIARTDNGSLVNGQFLGLLATGILKNTTATGALSISSPLTSIDGLSALGNQFLYTTGVNTYGLLATANDAVLGTNGAGAPSFSQTLPIPVQDNITRLGTQAEDLNMGTHLINNVLDPISAQDAATKNYVDTVAVGLNVQPAVAAASIDNFSATYANGTAGVGATLTATANGAFSLDGVAGVLNARYLIKDQTSTFQNGIYTLTQVGTAGTPAILTRAADYDTIAEITPGDFVVVNGGATNANTGWVQTATVAVIGTDAVLFSLLFSTADADQSNLIIGGNFDTNPWQRGTTYTAVITGTRTADMFLWAQNGGGVVDILKTADAPTVAQAGVFTSNCHHVDTTTADASIGAAEFYYPAYRMEGYDWAQLAQRTFTLSFWVKSTKTGIFCVAFTNTGVDRSYVSEYTINAADTWEFKTITVSPSPSSGTWNYTNGIGLEIRWTIAAGSDSFTTAGAWQVGNFRCTANQVNGMDSTSNNFKLGLIKIQPGSAATPWQLRSACEELKLCQRYFTKTFNTATAPASGAGGTLGALEYYVHIAGVRPVITMWYFPVTMRTSPTMTFYNPVNANSNWYNFGVSLDSGAGAAVGIGERSAAVVNVQLATDNAQNQLVINATASAAL